MSGARSSIDQRLARFVRSPISTLRRRHLTRLRWKGGLVRCHPDGILPFPILATPDVLERETVENFCWAYRPKQGDVVLDIGAGLGTEVLAFSRMVGPEGRVVAVEAHPKTYRILERVRDLNRLRNVEVLNLAVSDRAGTLAISNVDNEASNSIVNRTALRTGTTSSVRATTLDQLVIDLAIPRIDLLKMNIEGAERQAVRGGRETLGIVCHAAISCHDFVADDGRGGDEMRTRAEVHRALVDSGFEVVSRDDDPRPHVRSYLYATRSQAQPC